MAYASQYGYQLHSDPAVDDSKRRAYFEPEDDSADLDPAILNAGMMSPSSSHFRKDSLHSTGVLSPAESSGWDPYGHGVPVENSAGASNSYHENNVFVRPAASHPPAYGHPPPTWTFDHGSGTNTPTTGFEFMPPLPQGAPGPFNHGPPEMSHANFGPAHFNGLPVEPQGYIPAPQVQTPMSPHSHQDWMGMAQQEMDSRPLPKRMRPNSPPRTYADFQRRDGIRKKNGRIEIPQERSIHTIDDLIEKSTNEDEIKELKAQKRLLRNREAALASRQRKKKHTEDLEVKEKTYTTQISYFEQRVADLTLENDNLLQERQMFMHRQHEDERIRHMLEGEKTDLVMKHTEETSRLRKQILFLTEQLDAGPAPAMSAQPSSTGFTEFNADMEALNMGPYEWDNFMSGNDLHTDLSDDFTFIAQPDLIKPSPVETAPSHASTAQLKKPADFTSEQPIASGLLFMLLLCGAFVASRSATTPSSNLPKVPEEVRLAAPAVLNTLLSEVASPSKQRPSTASINAGLEPAPSGAVLSPSRNTNRMDKLHHRLTAPTKQQDIDQAFALTPAQYASLTSPGNVPHHDDGATPTRRNLAEALSNLRQESQSSSSTAEVYTRSLLWDQIPADVVKQFKQMVQDSNEIDAKQQKVTERRDRRRSNHHEDMFGYKMEA